MAENEAIRLNHKRVKYLRNRLELYFEYLKESAKYRTYCLEMGHYSKDFLEKFEDDPPEIAPNAVFQSLYHFFGDVTCEDYTFEMVWERALEMFPGITEPVIEALEGGTPEKLARIISRLQGWDVVDVSDNESVEMLLAEALDKLYEQEGAFLVEVRPGFYDAKDLAKEFQRLATVHFDEARECRDPEETPSTFSGQNLLLEQIVFPGPRQGRQGDLKAPKAALSAFRMRKSGTITDMEIIDFLHSEDLVQHAEQSLDTPHSKRVTRLVQNFEAILYYAENGIFPMLPGRRTGTSDAP